MRAQHALVLDDAGRTPAHVVAYSNTTHGKSQMIHIDIYTNVMSVAGGLIIILAFVLYGQRILYDHTAPNGTDEDGKRALGLILLMLLAWTGITLVGMFLFQKLGIIYGTPTL